MAAPSDAARGPLGPLRGMTYDPIRKRYFPSMAGPASSPAEVAAATPPPLPTLSLPSRGELLERQRHGGRSTAPYTEESLSAARCAREGAKRRRLEETRRFEERLRREEQEAKERLEALDSEGVSSTFRRRTMMRRKGDIEKGSQFHIAGLNQMELYDIVQCDHEKVTSLKSMMNGAYYATTDAGRIVVSRTPGEEYFVNACQAEIMAMHMDIPRMSSMSISAGTDPHIHHFRRDPDGLDQWTHQVDVELPKVDLYASSSYDGQVSIAAKNLLISLTPSESDIRPDLCRRPTTSDPLAIHHATPDLVYLGLRKGIILQEDLRVPPRMGTVVAVARPPNYRTPRAVVGVKRLNDGASPWGMAVSALGHDIMIFDIRHGKEPLHQLVGHNNEYRTDLGFTTNADDSIVLAASDERMNHHVRAWSTLTGEVIRGRVDTDRRKTHKYHNGIFNCNMLETGFRERVTQLQCRDDGGVDAVSGGRLYRLGPVYYGPNGKGTFNDDEFGVISRQAGSAPTESHRDMEDFADYDSDASDLVSDYSMM